MGEAGKAKSKEEESEVNVTSEKSELTLFNKVTMLELPGITAVNEEGSS